MNYNVSIDELFPDLNKLPPQYYYENHFRLETDFDLNQLMNLPKDDDFIESSNYHTIKLKTQTNRTKIPVKLFFNQYKFQQGEFRTYAFFISYDRDLNVNRESVI